MVDESTLTAFKDSLDGDLLLPRDVAYEEARLVFNAMIDRRPSLIVRCKTTDDIVAGVRFAREHGLTPAVRGGGHSVAGNAVCDGGLMLDLSAMKGVRIDADRRIAVAEPGLTLGEMDRATQAYGLATPLGVVSVTGIAGLTLGGGIGWLNGKYGLSCDNLIEAEVVTADGRCIHASADENTDLFWALRGGSGNFGVVCSFTYRLHPVHQVLAGSVTYAPSQAAEAMRFYDGFAATMPDELTTMGGLGRNEKGEPVFGVTVCYCGDQEDGLRVVSPLREFGTPIEDTIGLMDYVSLQSSADGAFPHGRQHYWKASFIKTLSDGAIETILRFVAEMPSTFNIVGLQQMTGVASRVLPDATAFAHRARQFDFLILSQWVDQLEAPRNIEWARSFFEAMKPYLEQGVYTNNLGNEGEDRVKDAFGGNYARLATIKAKYDPDNFFRMNANIKPV